MLKIFGVVIVANLKEIRDGWKEFVMSIGMIVSFGIVSMEEN